MAVNVITNATAADWIPEIWAQEVLGHLRANMPIASRVNRDYSSQVATYGDTVNVPKPITLTAQNKPVSGTANLTLDNVSVALNSWKSATPVLIQDLALAQSRPNIIANLTRAGAISLATAVETDLASLYSSLTYNVGTYGTNVSASTIAAADKKLFDNLAPSDQERYAVLSSKDYAALLGDSNITNALNFGGAEAIRAGQIPSLYGMNILRSQLVQTTVATPTQTHNLAFHRDAFAIVTRALPAPQNGTGALYAVVTDDETQLTFRMLLQYDILQGGHYFDMDILYGVAVLRDELGVVVKG
jgi:hypothetical protein